MTQWSFTATSGQMVDRTVNPASLTWIGVVAIGGMVRVAGTVGGATDSATAVLSVTARSWTKTTVKDHTIVNPSTLADRPANMEALGDFVGTLPTDSNVSRWLGTIQDDGPNHGFTYMLDLPPVTTTVAQVNGNAINGTSIFYQVQEPRRKKIQGLWYCPQSVVTGVLFSLVEKHEGAVTPPETYQYSHAALFRADVDTKANQRYEPVVGFEAQDVVGPVSATLQTEANQKSLNMHFDGTNYVNTQSLGNCETFHFTYPP